jgi:hypothetical protein
MPEGPENFLYKLGLKSRYSQAAALVVLAGLVYLIFIPNFLFVKTITIEGVGEEQQTKVRSNIDTYFANVPFFNPQRNIVFLKKSSLEKELLEDPTIYKVMSIKKSVIKRSLTITVEPKTERFLANRAGLLYSVYNDGTIKEQVPGDPAAWLNVNPGLIKVKQEAGDPLNKGTHYLSDQFLAQLNSWQGRFQAVTGKEVSFFEIPVVLVNAVPAEVPATSTATMTAVSGQQSISVTDLPLPLRPDDINIYVKKNIPNYRGPAPDFKVLIEGEQDMEDTLGKLTLLLNQMPPDRYTKLYYIDMRFENRGFICLVGTPCAQEKPVVPDPIVVPPPSSETPAASATPSINNSLR